MGALICRFVLQVFVALVFSFYLVFSDLIPMLFSNAYTNGLAALLRPEEGDRNGSGAAEGGLAVEENWVAVISSSKGAVTNGNWSGCSSTLALCGASSIVMFWCASFSGNVKIYDEEEGDERSYVLGCEFLC